MKFKITTSNIKAIEERLKGLPDHIKSKPFQDAQARAAQIFKKDAQAEGRQLGGTESWSKAQQVERGKNARFFPYVVVRTADKKFMVRPKASHMTPNATLFRPIKYNHLLQQGSKAGERIGGVGKALGTKRPTTRPLLFGSTGGRRLTGKGGFIVKNARTGYLHRIKSISHPGAKGEAIYDDVLARNEAAAVNKFNTDVIGLIDKFKTKNGFA